MAIFDHFLIIIWSSFCEHKILVRWDLRLALCSVDIPSYALHSSFWSKLTGDDRRIQIISHYSNTLPMWHFSFSKDWLHHSSSVLWSLKMPMFHEIFFPQSHWVGCLVWHRWHGDQTCGWFDLALRATYWWFIQKSKDKNAGATRQNQLADVFFVV